MPDPLLKLTTLFERFPGIGPRQANRFVQFLLRASPTMRRQLVEAIRQVGSTVHECSECFLFFAESGRTCPLCADPARDRSSLAIVATDADLSALERSHIFKGRYFVFGGTISLASEKTNGLRLPQLLSSLPKRIEEGLEEIILAFPANPEGDTTAERIRAELLRVSHIKITALGRGLSTGSELEYADSETIKSALESRR